MAGVPNAPFKAFGMSGVAPIPEKVFVPKLFAPYWEPTPLPKLPAKLLPLSEPLPPLNRDPAPRYALFWPNALPLPPYSCEMTPPMISARPYFNL